MAKFCGKCGRPIEMCTCGKTDRGGFGFAGRTFSTGAKIGDIVLGEGERFVRSYDIARYFVGHGFIKLYITNKRLVIYTENRGLLNTRNTTYYNETNLEKVQGLSAGVDSRVSALGIFLALLMIIGGIVGICANSVSSVFSDTTFTTVLYILLIVLAIGLMIISCKPIVTFGITGGHDNDHMSINNGIMGGNGRFLLLQKFASSFYPIKGFEKVITEAGACIFDLRTYGDEAIEKWKK